MSTRPTTTFPTQTIPDGTSSYVIRPLTTAFVPPPECPDLISEDFDTTSRSCAPDDWSPAGLNWLGYYSPAICPQGYTVGCDAWNDARRSSMEDRFGAPDDTSYYPAEGTTAALCVPANFRCWDEDVWTAISVRGSSTQYERAFQIRWEESDLIYLETHPMSPGVTPWTSAEAVTGPTSDVTGGDNNNGGDTGGDNGGDDGGKSGLSSGAIAGIAVGALAGVLAIVGIAVFVWWRKRKSAQGHVPVPQGPPAPPGVPEMAGGVGPPGHYGGTPVSNQQHLSVYSGSPYDPHMGGASPGMPGAAGFPNPNADPRYSYMGAPGPNGYSPQPQQLAYGAVPPNGASPDMVSSQGTTPQPGVVAGGYPVQQQQVPPVHHFEMDGTSAQPPPPAELSSDAPPPVKA